MKIRIFKQLNFFLFLYSAYFIFSTFVEETNTLIDILILLESINFNN